MNPFLLPENVIYPYDLINKLRDKNPVHQLEPGVWIVSRYESVKNGLKEPVLLSSKRKMELCSSPLLREECRSDLFITTQDPPVHNCSRKSISEPFNKKNIDHLMPQIEMQAAISTDAIKNKRNFEFFSAFSYPYIGDTINKLLGLDGLQTYSESHRWIKALEATTTTVTGSELQDIERIILNQKSIFNKIIVERQKCPFNDFLSGLIKNNPSEKAFTRKQLVSVLELLYRGGYQTSVHLLATAIIKLIRHPDIRLELIAEPELVPVFIEEILRLYSPVPAVLRHTTKDYLVNGVTIPEGDAVWLSLAGANRDPDHFSNPNEIDFSRIREATPLAFGFSSHVCIGMYLAKLETEIALNHLLPLVGSMACPADRDLKWTSSLVFRGISELPITHAI